MKFPICVTNRKHTASFWVLSLLLAIAPLWLMLAATNTSAHAQGTPPSWLQAFGTSGAGSNIGNAIKIGPDQNLYVGGQFSATATFGNTTVSAIGPFDIFLAKYSPSGALLWIAQTSQTAGDGDHDKGNRVDLDADGNVYLAGSFRGNATFYSAKPGDKKISLASGVPEAIFLAKYTSSGTLLWVQTGTSDCGNSGCPIIGYGVAVNSAAGTVYVTGITQADTTFSSANGSAHVASGPWAWHMVLAKYDINGNSQWAETDSASPNSGGEAVAVDANDNAYVTGWFENTTTWTSANGHDITVVGLSPAQSDGNYPSDTFLAKYDKNGNAIWVNDIGGYKANPSAVTIGPGGEITLVGFVGNINYGSPGEAETIVTSQPPGASINLGGGVFTNPFNVDGETATYNSAGVAIRAFRHGGAGNESTTGVAYDSRDNLYVTGLAVVSGKPHVFVDAYSGANFLWEATGANAGVGSGEVSITPALSVDAAGSVYVTGGYSGTASFGNIKLSGGGTSQMFVSELNTAFAKQSADLLLRLYASATTVHQGDLLTFTFPVWNRGPNVAYLEELKTQVPQGTTFDYIRISGTPGLGTCTHPPYQGTGEIVCYENSAMAPNTTWTLRLTVKVTAPSGSVITETGTATEVTPDPNTADATSTVNVAVE